MQWAVLLITPPLGESKLRSSFGGGKPFGRVVAAYVSALVVSALIRRFCDFASLRAE